jgi:hypothetical protein
MESAKNIKNPKIFVLLNFNLKNWVFSFLDFEEIISNLFFVHSEFTKSLNKNKMIKFFKENFNYLMQQIHFSNQKLKEIKREFSENFEASEETYHQIFTYILIKKYKTENQLHLKWTYIPAKIISTYISKQKHLKILNLAHNNLAKIPLNLKYLSDIVIKLTNSLELLYLNDNEIGKNPTDMKYLSQALSLNNSIRDLDLSWNEIGKNKLDIYYLCQALKRNRKLENLYLYNNLIGNNKEDMVFLKDALKINRIIKDLDLSWNCIGENIKDFDFLANGLKENKSLLIINLTKNLIDNFENINMLKKESPNIMIVSFGQD